MNTERIEDALYVLAKNTHTVALAITPNASLGRDEAGGEVHSLTEAVMGITSGLYEIAIAINNLAQAVEAHGMEKP
jgi:hypothetical protein